MQQPQVKDGAVADGDVDSTTSGDAEGLRCALAVVELITGHSLRVDIGDGVVGLAVLRYADGLPVAGVDNVVDCAGGDVLRVGAGRDEDCEGSADLQGDWQRYLVALETRQFYPSIPPAITHFIRIRSYVSGGSHRLHPLSMRLLATISRYLLACLVLLPLIRPDLSRSRHLASL